MKHCPVCQRTYSDTALNFCRADGTALVVGGGATIAAAPNRIAETCALLGSNDQAFEWLEKAYRERHFRLLVLKVELRLDGLRSDPRFAGLLRRTGLYAAD